jgi:predicted ATPase
LCVVMYRRIVARGVLAGVGIGVSRVRGGSRVGAAALRATYGRAVRPLGTTRQRRLVNTLTSTASLESALLRSSRVLASARLLSERPRFQAGNRSHFSTSSPLTVYKEKVKNGQLSTDQSQVKALELLEPLFNEVQDYNPGPLVPLKRKTGEGMSLQDAVKGFSMEKGSDRDDNSGGGFFSSLFGSSKPKPAAKPKQSTVVTQRSGTGKTPKGLYMFGGVGCGKTMVMDMFFDQSPVRRKRRVHFNAFMLECHDRMHRLRQSGVSEDPIPHLARQILDECYLLCFDEMQVTDIGDALLLRRLFDELFHGGIIVVATSNRPPDDLYYNGIQRHLFVPFIKQVKEKSNVFDFNSKEDYRLAGTLEGSTYITPLSDEGSDKVEALWKELTKNSVSKPVVLTRQGRNINVPMAAEATDTARFTFSDLCEKPLGAGDYLTIAGEYHTVFITGIPVLTTFEVNEMRRFITMIDVFYEHKTKVVVSAAAEPLQLFQTNVPDPDANNHGDLLGTAEYTPVVKDEVFAFDRTVSRLTEMQSVEYLRIAGPAHNKGN